MDAFYVSAKLLEDVRELTAVVVKRHMGSMDCVAYYPCSLDDYYREKIGIVDIAKKIDDNGESQIITKGNYARVALINCSRI